MSVLTILAIVSYAMAASLGEPIGVQVTKVMVNGAEITGDEDIKTQFLRGDELDLVVVLSASQTQSNVEVETFIAGDEHNDISVKAETFDVENNTVYQKHFKLVIPDDVQQDNYKLRILVTDRYGAAYNANYNIKIDTQMHDIYVKDIDLSSSSEIKAGRSFTAIVNMKNMGEKDEDNVKVIMEVPELGLTATDYIDNFAAEDTKQSEELYVRVPDCAAPGDYKVKFTVKYDDNHKEATAERTVKIVEGDLCGVKPSDKNKLTIIVGTDAQTVARESTTVYGITLINGEQESKTYTIEVSGTSDWAATTTTPSNVVIVGAGESKTIAVSVTPGKDTKIEQKAFTVKVKSGETVLKEMPFTANVIKQTASSWDAVKQGLQIGLVILVVILVVLGVVLLVNRMKEPKTEEESSAEDLSDMPKSGSETYY